MFNRIRKVIGKVLGYRDGVDRQTILAALQKIRATYDAARTTNEFENYWSNADRLDADSANSQAIRKTLVSRSRYEFMNNAYADGIAQTITNDLVGIGPALRMQTASTGFNQLVELSWTLWSDAIGLRRKLWTMAHAKHVDGEAFAQLRRNPRVTHPIKLDVILYETEQCQTPFIPFNDPRRIDGIVLDEFGNPSQYEFLKYHPGSTRQIGVPFNDTEFVPASQVLHWFRVRRPGQHRGIPEMISSLNAGAAARRWREATLSAAERAALLTLMMKTQQSPDTEDFVSPFSTMDVDKGLMTFLPAGWDPMQLEGKFPTATHQEFSKSLVGEMGRSVNMPLNKAMCDSSSYNYASGRLDHGTYYDSLDVARVDCGSLVLSKLFNAWFDLAIIRFGWLGGNPEAVTSAARIHLWDWPKHRVADVEAEANANATKLKSGQTTLSCLYSDAGEDYDDEVEQMAEDYGITPDEMRMRLLDVILPGPKETAPATVPSVPNDNMNAGWVTLDNGVHIEIGDDGTITKGPNSMRGKTLSQVKHEHETGTWPTPKQKSKSRAKLSIDQANKELDRIGWKLGPAVPWKPGDKDTTYKITHKKTGKVEHKTASQIRDVISSFDDAPLLDAGRFLAQVNGNGAHSHG